MVPKLLRRVFSCAISLLAVHAFAHGSDAVSDVRTFAKPSEVRLDGIIGIRLRANVNGRLLKVDENELLAGFQHRPGSQAWVGEHIGKWMDGASLACAAGGDQALKQKLDRVVAALLATQEPDGYLGTYNLAKRWKSEEGFGWDVWTHQYVLTGLLSYHDLTGSAAALTACRRAGNLLVDTFGPGKMSLNQAGDHLGLAATSVLELIVDLWRATGDARFLRFAEDLVNMWDEPGGAHILSGLEQKGTVLAVGDAKGYEGLANFVGLAELFRASGRNRYLKDVLIAWEDIVKHRLYVTGAQSSSEYWRADGVMPFGEASRLGETCATFTWIQLNAELFRLLGEARYMDQIEIAMYNHLLGAQRPDGVAWCTFTPLEGRKPYDAETNCCLSSGSRAMPFLPHLAYASSAGRLYVNLYEAGTADLPVPRIGKVRIVQSTAYPIDGKVTLTIQPKKATSFGLNLRIPMWASAARITVCGKPLADSPKAGTYASIERRWKPGDRVEVDFAMKPTLAHGEAGPDRVAVKCGPLVYAADAAHNPGLDPMAILVAPDATPRLRGSEIEIDCLSNGVRKSVRLVPFYEAGVDGSPVEVWLHMKPTTGS